MKKKINKKNPYTTGIKGYSNLPNKFRKPKREYTRICKRCSEPYQTTQKFSQICKKCSLIKTSKGGIK